MTEAGFLTGLSQGLRRCKVSGQSILIAISGGADSVALFRGLLELRDEFELTLRAAHLNHGLRGEDSENDAAWVHRLADKYEVQFEVGRAFLDPAASGIEEAARGVRLQFLSDVANAQQCSVIATGHNADDQVETVIHHIFRGTGISGLRGIPFERHTELGCRFVRPLLRIHRPSIEAYLAAIGQDYRQDATNSDTSLTRNWLRHELLPELRSRVGAHIDSAIIRLAEQAATVEETLSVLAGRLLDMMTLEAQPLSVRLNVRGLTGEPVHLVREVFCMLWERQRWPRKGMGFAEWNRIAEVALAGGDINLPGGIRARQNPPGLLILEKTNR